MTKIWKLTIEQLGIVELDSEVSVSVRRLKAMLEQAYQSGKMDAIAEMGTRKAEDPMEVFKQMFGKN